MRTLAARLFVPVALAACAGLAALALAEDKTADSPIADGSGFAWLDGNDDVPATVERKRVQKGIPRDGHPRDIIPSIDRPLFYDSHAGAEVGLDLLPDDRVLGVVIDGDARAYPTRILDRHEIANDTVGGRPIAVVW